MSYTGSAFFLLYKLHLALLLFVLTSFTASAQQNLFSKTDPISSHIDFNNVLVETEQKNVLTYQYFYNGAGVGVADFNNDGLPDIFFAGNMVSDRLYLNKGNFVFEDITKTAGLVKTSGWSTGVALADVNADGWMDIYVCRSGPWSASERINKLYINNRNNTFTDMAKDYGLNDSAFSTQAVFFDMDKDNDLDMFLLNHAVTQVKGFILQDIRKQRDPFAGNKLYKNENGYFRDVSEIAGISGSPINFGLGIAVGDINNDNAPDIFVTNDYNETDQLYLNNGYGTFTEILKTAMGHTSNFSMGCDMADINNDGLLDLFVADMLPEDNYRQKILQGPTHYDMYQLSAEYGYGYQIMQNTLQINNGNNTFSEIANYSGVAATDWSWAPLFADFDNDGFQDLFISNGYRRDFTDLDFMKYTFAEEEKTAFQNGEKVNTLTLVEKMPSVKIPNYIFQGNSDLQFENKTLEWGLETASFSNGAAYADLDMDGDLDLIINNINDTAFLYKNNAEIIGSNHFLEVRIKGFKNNRNAVGTRVIASLQNNIYVRELMPQRGYASSVEPLLHFGLGDADSVRLSIIFPDGKKVFYEPVKTDTILEIDIKNMEASVTIKIPEKKLFTDVTNEKILYKHNEEKSVDFKTEPLLPYTLSQEGPPLCTGDFNADNIPDLYIGGAKNKKGKIFMGVQNGSFIPYKNISIENDSAYEDVAAIFFDVDGDSDVDLYVVSGGNEYPINSEFYQDRLYLNAGNGNFSRAKNNIPPNFASKSCVCANDFDQDGDLDLFVGGRLITGRFPLSPASMILENKKGNFSDVTMNVCPALQNAGMVNDAVWVDVNSDKRTDLIVLGDFTPIRVFINEDYRFTDKTEAFGLINSHGWWNSISAGDFDADGDLDLIAGNIGTNNRIKTSTDKPATVFVYDFDQNGTLDPILNYYYNDSISHPFPSRDDLLDQINMLKKKYVYYKDYGNATMQSIFPELNISSVPFLKAELFESVYLENTGNTFIIKKLPPEAQWFPINCSIIKDFDQDGKLDVLIAGNDYGIRPELGRMDAGNGLFLAGNGKGDLKVITNMQTGLNINGDTKNMVLLKLMGKEYIVIVKNKNYAQVIRINE